MEKRIYDLPNAPLPLDKNSYYEVLVPDGSSATGYTSCRIKPSNISGFKKYKALLSQSGTSAPTVHILENTLSGAPVWSYSSNGVYNATLSNEFTLNKTSVKLGQYHDSLISHVIISTSVISVNSQDLSGGTPSASNGLLDNTVIEIEVYP